MTHYLITGGTGLVGRALVNHLSQRDDTFITILTRQTSLANSTHITYVNWHDAGWENQIPDVDVVINLAGATLNQRWTARHQQVMMTSRIQATRALFDLFKNRAHKPKVLFNASAMGCYRPSLNTIYIESAHITPHDLLSEIVYQWERQAALFESFGTRVIDGRFSLILSRHGGALPKMALPYNCFVGGRLGTGKQWYSWIHITDVVRAICFLIDTPEASGPYHFASPSPTTQHHFGQCLASILNRPHYTWVPACILRLILGKMATLLLDTPYIVPQRLTQLGFTFQYPTLHLALKALYHESKPSPSL
ncbi:TIGR01777 family oxidoreductase [Staphylococcus lutrae]|uniref:TIGR01777 family oxidoreductase n=1 Tax=Staphylococcus lutrae TaxID=155085 RepID=UPI000CD22581|nr:TIGR01777 family oxidoreductase [Staphylococcus lutrae]PNZ37242.1 TIGR01777 family protein [Staphylococcus lutrae]